MKKNIVWGLILALIGIITFLSLKEEDKIYNYALAQKRDLVQKVSVTGRVEPIKNVDLTFEQTGKIEKVNVAVGDRVTAGDILVTMSSQELWADLAQVNADLQAAEARYKEAQRGTRNEQIQIQKEQVLAAKKTLEDVQIKQVDSIRNAFTQADITLQNKIDGLFYGTGSLNRSPKLKIKNNYGIETNDINNAYQDINRHLYYWKNKINRIEEYGAKSVIEEGKKILYEIQDMLDLLAKVINNTLPYSGMSGTQLEVYKGDIALARTTIDTTIMNIESAIGQVNAAQDSLRITQKQLIFQESGNSEEQIEMAKAQLESAKARKQRVQAQINKTILRAPFNGIITKQEAQKGEVISLLTAKEILVSMVGEGYEIEINVPEVDVSKIKIGDTVEIEFDAFEDEMFESAVTFIEPAETIVQGVVYYQVKVALDLETIPLEIRSGMSVDVDIITDSRENVLALPQRVVIKKDGDRYVRVLREESESGEKMVEEVSVETGLRGSNGKIEIVSGIQEGAKVLTSTTEE